jgi:hypothetical protein
MILGLLTKLGIPQWLAELLLGALIVIALFGGGFYLGDSHRGDADTAAADQAQIAHLQQLQALQAKGEALQAKFDTARAQTVVEYRTITKEVPHVTTVYRPAPGAALQPLPAAVFTRGFVRVWNSALDPGVPAPAGGAAPAPGAADPADDLASGLQQQQLLENHVDNAAGCTAVRQQLNALIDWHQQIGDR